MEKLEVAKKTGSIYPHTPQSEEQFDKSCLFFDKKLSSYRV